MDVPFSYQNLYSRYLLELKPLVAEFESRNEAFVEGLLENIGLMFDQLAMNYTYGDECHLKEAERHLDMAIEILRVALNAKMMDRIAKFKRRVPKKVIEALDNGKFVGKFNSLQKTVQQYKNSDSKRTYCCLREICTLLDNAHSSHLSLSLLLDSRVTVVIKWILTIAIALVINFLIFYIYK